MGHKVKRKTNRPRGLGRPALEGPAAGAVPGHHRSEESVRVAAAARHWGRVQLALRCARLAGGARPAPAPLPDPSGPGSPLQPGRGRARRVRSTRRLLRTSPELAVLSATRPRRLPRLSLPNFSIVNLLPAAPAVWRRRGARAGTDWPPPVRAERPRGAADRPPPREPAPRRCCRQPAASVRLSLSVCVSEQPPLAVPGAVARHVSEVAARVTLGTVAGDVARLLAPEAHNGHTEKASAIE